MWTKRKKSSENLISLTKLYEAFIGWKEAQRSFEVEKQQLGTSDQKASEPYSGAREATRVVIERTFLRENDEEQETTCFGKDVWFRKSFLIEDRLACFAFCLSRVHIIIMYVAILRVSLWSNIDICTARPRHISCSNQSFSEMMRSVGIASSWLLCLWWRPRVFVSITFIASLTESSSNMPFSSLSLGPRKDEKTLI